ncbi:hypothetical protein RO3G_09564 [Rhizopus delemar RA 99-880]|uniref:C4-dicarboxylate transporter/malic acid transport protein n=1 Tax=Rhizopus delemar (strain RA 99-880 / ATCC MYA-4621 / FGSC 9543 / NRRL 43880) TaxID=246409 RepID=I1C8S4_RHIO9|nr:hypothetical protein RO3G_09564 [Rhizopus delemar RA 99-880]|eukprot:EIE84854.1 hypothetical protein RO3G_09564 [Rhizopus delemar RA 99-880]
MIEKKKKGFSEVIRHFTPSWFSVTMGTGIISILLQGFPFQFKGLQTISLVIYLINVVVYCVLTIITILRYIMFPGIFMLMIKHPAQMPYYFIVHHAHALETMNGTWLLPIVPAVVTAASGGLLCHYLDQTKALVILIISYITMGVGLLLALSIIVIYFYRLAIHKLPPKEVIISAFLPLGPLGQGAYGMIQLGSGAQLILGDRYISSLGNTAYGTGFIIALLLWGYGLWYLVIAICSVGITLKQKIPFNMGWWGLTFPLGVYTAATLAIAKILDSMFFYVLTSIFTCSLVILWIIVAIKTIIGAATGKLFLAPCLSMVQ